jgi:hypothetical protein
MAPAGIRGTDPEDVGMALDKLRYLFRLWVVVKEFTAAFSFL